MIHKQHKKEAVMKHIVQSLIFFLLISCSSLNAQWQSIWGPGPNSGSVYSVCATGSNLFYGVIGNYIYRSTDYGSTWDSSYVVSAASPYLSFYFYCFAVSSNNTGGTNIYAGTSGGVFLSTDNGSTWNTVNTGLTNLEVRALAVSDSNIFAGTKGGGVFRSTNNGTSWTAVNSGLGNLNIYSLFIDGTKLYAGYFGGVYASSNLGANWASVSSFPFGYFTVTKFAKSGTYLFAGWSNGVCFSTNNGLSWSETLASSGLKDSYGAVPGANDFAVKDNMIFVGTASGIFLSLDNGTTWTNVGSLYAMGLAISGTNIYAGTYYNGKVWRRPISEMVTSVNDQSSSAVKSFALEQNYPNPFNPSTTISFHLAKQSQVSLKIYDLTGKEIATLVNESLPAGAHSAVWDASRYASGVYFYKLSNGISTEVKKLILMK
jgi:photosystem II stability/assembly factor-like uncharacterized protein